ncbi:hypothetical protein MMC30_006626 [Trapelia coarctata]|nr:hypothetical protein [Trapelia coarctata]
MHLPLRLLPLLTLLLPILANPLPAPDPNADAIPAPDANPLPGPTTDIAALTAAKALVPKDAAPNPDANPEPGTKTLSARSARCTITADGVRYRTCPRTSCTAVGQYPIGTVLTFSCYTTGTTVNGDSIWDRASNGYYSADVSVATLLERW